MQGAVAPPELVAAVSNAGGLGVTGLTDVEPEEIRRRIRRIRELTDRPFGIDLLLPRRWTRASRSRARRCGSAWSASIPSTSLSPGS